MTPPRHRGQVSRLVRLARIEWGILAAAQWMILIGAAAGITAVWTGVAIPRWALTAGYALLAVYALGVLSRGRPPLPDVTVTRQAAGTGHRRGNGTRR